MVPGIQTFNTSDLDLFFVKMLVHGPSGAGKTQLIKTVEDPSRSYILSAESGLLSVAGTNMNGAVVATMSDLVALYTFFASDSAEAAHYNFIHIDSITEIGDICLNEELAACKNKLQAFGNYAARMSTAIKKFRDLPNKHVYMTAKETCDFDDNNVPYYGPMFHGKKLAPNVPHDFDIVATVRVFADPENPGLLIRQLQTAKDPNYRVLKDRSGALPPLIDLDFQTIFAAIRAKFPNLS